MRQWSDPSRAARVCSSWKELVLSLLVFGWLFVGYFGWLFVLGCFVFCYHSLDFVVFLLFIVGRCYVKPVDEMGCHTSRTLVHQEPPLLMTWIREAPKHRYFLGVIPHAVIPPFGRFKSFATIRRKRPKITFWEV